ncbi:actin-related Arp23 like WD 40 repeate [Cryptosporidium sp. chipmunk genotype I]|uniref:actin-related Arp23 like WD 40 repeate n=1 Tax=Cryptosporidium sp. chipmunk genotype I TaxID=1280935 RepID=UPI00351A6DB1|nr:actin-related Arp23 like WD 40 repeate [Cryptosporidium sp. chipmunk genotype I]
MKLLIDKQLETSITGISFHPNWKYISLVCEKRNIQIYQLSDLHPRNCLAKLSKHRNRIVSIDWSLLPTKYSLDSSYSQLVSVGEDRLVIVWLLKAEPEKDGFPEKLEIVSSILNCIQSDCYPTFCRLSPFQEFCSFVVSTTSGEVFFFTSKKSQGLENEKTSLSKARLRDLYVFDQLKVRLSELPLTCLAWSNNNKFLACGGLENKGIILRVSIEDSNFLDENLDGNFPEPLSIQALSSIESQNAIMACNISPKGGQIVFTDKDSFLYFTQVGKKLEFLNSSLKWNGLPLINLKFVHEKLLAAVGHDCIPVLFIQANGCMWTHATTLNGAILPNYLDPVWQLNFDPIKHYTQNSVHKRPIMEVLVPNSSTLVCYGFDGKYSIWELELCE